MNCFVAEKKDANGTIYVCCYIWNNVGSDKGHEICQNHTNFGFEKKMTVFYFNHICAKLIESLSLEHRWIN